jgi:hypothetical protein
VTESWDCFIAYPRPQQALAVELADLLSSRVRVFVDKHALRLGDHWPRALAAALESAPITIVIVAPETERAFYEQEEIVRAVDRARGDEPDRRVVPLFVGEVTPDDARIPYGLRAKQGHSVRSTADLAAVADAIVTLVREINAYADAGADPTDEPRTVSDSIRLHLANMRVEVDQLTRDQYRVINQLRHMRRVRISGSAGSGKTLVAAEKATRLGRAGLRVLFLCHNPLLAEHVQGLTAGASVEVRDFVRWVSELVDTPLAANGGEWTHYAEPLQPALDRALERLTSRGGVVDAIVVDEGQDFRAEWWAVVEAGLADAENGHLYIFHDNNQSLLAHRASYPIPEPHVDLSRNCRNAGRVLDLMRCFDSSAPEAELGLHARGRAQLRRYETGTEIAVLTETFAFLDKEKLLEESVVLVTADEPLASSFLAGCAIGVPVADPWQDEVRAQFSKVLNIYANKGLVPPRGGEKWIEAALSKLSMHPFPTPQDVECVRSVAKGFSVSHAIRTEIMENPGYRNALSWQLVERKPRIMRRRSAGPLLAAEVIVHFQGSQWHRGLPVPRIVTLQPFYLPRREGTVPLYQVSDFKGLEAEAVVLVMRGRVANQREATYVGVSRARALLCVLADPGAFSGLPRSFVWD